jgi:hypothetical protein
MQYGSGKQRREADWGISETGEIAVGRIHRNSMHHATAAMVAGARDDGREQAQRSGVDN